MLGGAATHLAPRTLRAALEDYSRGLVIHAFDLHQQCLDSRTGLQCDLLLSLQLFTPQLLA